MNIKDILSDNTRSKPILFNADLYSGIYKKTEKIVCAVFLITDYQKDQEINKELIKDVRRVAKDTLLETAMFMSGTDMTGASSRVTGSLMGLRSLLYVLAAARGVRADLVDVLAREIDGVVALIGNLAYDIQGSLSEAIEYQPGYLETARRPRPLEHRTHRNANAAGAGLTKSSTLSTGEGGRREAILSIIRARGKVSIKDISDSITDVSEKTIQRELIDMIKDNVIAKDGERRWSRYSVSNR